MIHINEVHTLNLQCCRHQYARNRSLFKQPGQNPDYPMEKKKKNAEGAGIKMILLSTHLKKGRIILDVSMPSIIHWKRSHLLCICKYTQVHDYALS